MKKTLIIMVLLLFCLALLAENLPRPYPIPRPINPPTRMEEGLKGPVKTVISESGEFPYYYVESEYSADGLLLHGTVGRINFTANVSYSYNSMGFLTKIEATEFTGGQDYPSDPVFISYELDELGYPLVISESDADGEIWDSQTFSYSDSSYSVETVHKAREEEYSLPYNACTVYDSQGRKLSDLRYLEDLIIYSKRYEYSSDTVIEYWQDSLDDPWTTKSITKYNANGQILELISYASADTLLSKQNYVYDKYGNVIQESRYDPLEDTSYITKYQYTYDSYGNPLSQLTIWSDGKTERKTFTYKYY